MATELATAYISLIPSTKGIKGNLEKELGGAGESAAAKTESSFSKSSSRIGAGLKGALTGAAVGGAAVFAGVKIGKEILDAGARLESFRLKAKVVFEGSAADVRKWADKNNESFGMTDDELVGLAANFGDLIKPMGFTSEQATDMSKKTIGLAGALSSWSGGTRDAAEVSTILSKAMLGETDGLKELGIAISAADVDAKLAAKGQQDLTGSALEQAKALAVQELIFAKSTDAQKAWAEGGNKALNSQNKLKAMMAEAKETLAEKLTPAVTAAATWVGEKLPVAIAKAQEWFKAMQPTIQSIAGWLREHIPPAIATVQAVFQGIATWIQVHWPEISAIISSVIETVKSVISGAVTVIQAVWAAFGDNMLNYIKGTWDPIKNIIGGAMNIIQGMIKVVTSLIKGDWGKAWEGIKQIFSGIWSAIIGILQTAWNVIKLAIGVAWDIIKGIFKLAWDGIKALISAAIDAIIGFIKSIPGKVAAFAGTMWDAIKTAFGFVKDYIVGRVTDVINLLKSIPGKVAAFAGTMWDGVKNAFKVVKDFVTDGINGWVGIIKGMPARISAVASGMFDGIKTAFKAAINFIIRAWNRMEFKIPGFDPPGPGPSFGGFTLGLPDIPEFHSGGKVPGRPGEEVLIKAMAGEQVLTQKQASSVQAQLGQAARPTSGEQFHSHFYGVLDAYEAAAVTDATIAWKTSLRGRR